MRLGNEQIELTAQMLFNKPFDDLTPDEYLAVEEEVRRTCEQEIRDGLESDE